MGGALTRKQRSAAINPIRRAIGGVTALALSVVLAVLVTNDVALASASSSARPPAHPAAPSARPVLAQGTAASPPTTVPVTTTTVPAPAAAPAPPPTAPVPATTTAPAPTPDPASAPTSSAPPTLPAQGQATAYGCTAALSYLQAYAAPGFTFECPGTADGHQAMTCTSHPPECEAGQNLIAIADPCAAAYMNEASNSWVLSGQSDAPIDPYGYCTT